MAKDQGDDGRAICHFGPMTGETIEVRTLLTGRPVQFRGQDYSAIGKTPVAGKVGIGWLGLEGDTQVDRRYHGGWDKAIHLYPQDHYGWWREFFGGHSLLDAPGAFGENIASMGMTEEEVCLGDRFRLGSALVEVSQGRQPCWKVDHRFGRSDVMKAILRTGKCGVYFRVIIQGQAEAGAVMTLTERPLPEWNVARIFRLLVGGEAKRDPAAVRLLAAMPVLAEAWRVRAVALTG